MERITILTDLRGNKKSVHPDFCFHKLQYCNCNAKMIYGNCQLSTVTLAIDIGVVQETGTVLAKPIFPFQKL